MSDTSMTRRHALGVMGTAALALYGCGSTGDDEGGGGGGGEGGDGPVKIGLLVPLAGVYASLGEDMRAGWDLWLAEHGRTLGGREVQTVVADEGDGPDTAIPALQKLLQRDRVDAVVGIVSSAVALGAQDLVNRSKKLLIVANAGANAITGEGTSNYIWRTSFTNSQVPFALGQHLAENGDVKRVYTIAPDYAAGAESTAGFVQAFEKGGGSIAGSAKPPFQTTSDYQPYLSRIRSSNADATYCFFAGSEAVAFVKQYGEFGLAKRIPLFGAGFLTEGGVLVAQGDAAEGVQTSLHYAAALDNDANKAFVEAYTGKTKKPPTVYAMQTWDAAEVLHRAIEKSPDDLSGDALARALEGVGSVDNSPRGPWSFESRTPKQKFYLREVSGGENEVKQEIGTFDPITTSAA
jgi:branched-chain amino acid transport system substrate-binding protein